MKSLRRSSGIRHEIGSWLYEPEFSRLSDESGEEIFLEARLNKLFAFLLQNEGDILHRSDIMDMVWPLVRVNEDSLTKGVFDLRRLIQDKGLNEVEIETIRNVGYRLVLSQSPVAASKSRKHKLRFVAKAMLYTVLFLSFLVMFIRAIRYEN